MEDYLNDIDENLRRSIKHGSYQVDLVQFVSNDRATEDIIAYGNKKTTNDKN